MAITPNATNLTITAPSVTLGFGAITRYPDPLYLHMWALRPRVVGETPAKGYRATTDSSIPDRGAFLFSGEPLPIPPPRPDDPELANFHRKVIDYLRRLTQKIQSGEFGPGEPGEPQTITIPIFAAFKDANQPIDDTPSDVTWPKQIRVNTTYYTHSETTNPELVTVVQPGFYLVSVNLGHNVNYPFTNEQSVHAKLIDSDDNELDYGFSEGGGFLTDMLLSVAIPADTTLRVQAYSNLGIGSTILKAYHCRFSIFRIANLLTGGGQGTEEEFEWWFTEGAP